MADEAHGAPGRRRRARRARRRRPRPGWCAGRRRSTAATSPASSHGRGQRAARPVLPLGATSSATSTRTCAASSTGTRSRASASCRAWSRRCRRSTRALTGALAPDLARLARPLPARAAHAAGGLPPAGRAAQPREHGAHHGRPRRPAAGRAPRREPVAQGAVGRRQDARRQHRADRHAPPRIRDDALAVLAWPPLAERRARSTRRSRKANERQ